MPQLGDNFVLNNVPSHHDGEKLLERGEFGESSIAGESVEDEVRQAIARSKENEEFPWRERRKNALDNVPRNKRNLILLSHVRRRFEVKLRVALDEPRPNSPRRFLLLVTGVAVSGGGCSSGGGSFVFRPDEVEHPTDALLLEWTKRRILWSARRSEGREEGRD